MVGKVFGAYLVKEETTIHLVTQKSEANKPIKQERVGGGFVLIPQLFSELYPKSLS